METKRKRFIMIAIVWWLILLWVWFSFMRKLMIRKNPEDMKADINHDQILQQEQVQNSSEKQDITHGSNTNNVGRNNNSSSKKQQNHKNNQSNKNTKNKKTASWTSKITILLPKWIDISAFQELRKNIYKQEKIRANIIVAKNQNDYKQKLQAQRIHPTADIIMVPSVYLESFLDRWVHIPFKYSIAWFFHSSFQPLIESKQASFIPFALDPIVLRHKKDMFPDNLTLTMADLQSKLLTYSEKILFPFAFGINENDTSLLAQYKSPYPQYFWFLHILLEQAKINKSTYLIDFFMKIHARESAKLQLAVKKQKTRGCEDEPKLCLLANQEITSVPWWMSDAWYIKNLFKKDVMEQYTFHNFPVITKQYPVQGRGFLVNQKSPHITDAGERIKSYLDYAEQNDGSLWNNTLSAFNTHFQRQKIETKYLSLQEFFPYFTLFQWSLDDDKVLIEQSHFLDMLRGDWSKVIFLKEEMGK